MRNPESKIDSFSILSTILLGFDSRIDSKKKIQNRPKNRNQKGIGFDTALVGRLAPLTQKIAHRPLSLSLYAFPKPIKAASFPLSSKEGRRTGDRA